MKNKGYQIKFWMTAFAILIFGSGICRANAAESGSLLQISTEDENIVAYVECNSAIDSVEAQVAQYPCEDVEITGSEDISIHTVIMMDNSLSVTESNRENIKNILKQYVRKLPENEMVSFALFGEKIEFLAEKTQDTEELFRLIDGVEFHDQDTYLTDYLFQAVEKIENDPVYTRFIVISDGVDNKTIGITKDELMDKLKETSRPIYTIGHVYGENASQLKNMFALSRVTNGKELLIEDFADVNLIADGIHDFSNIYSFKIKIPQAVMDGGSRHVLLNLHTNEGNVEIAGEAPMPFGLIETVETTPTPAPTPTPTAEPTPQPTTEPAPEPEKKNEGIEVSKPAGLILLLLAVIALFLYRKKNNPKKESKKRKSKTVVNPPAQETVPVKKPEEDETVILDGRYLLILRDRSNPERLFRYPLDGRVIVGRSIDRVQIAIDDSRTISGQHCEFYARANRFFIRDLNSANHTYVNGKMINKETEVVSGSIVRIGEVEFNIEIMPI